MQNNYHTNKLCFQNNLFKIIQFEFTNFANYYIKANNKAKAKCN